MNFFARRFLSQAGSAIRINPLIGTTRYFSQVKLLSLDNLRVIPGSKKKRKRVGRGPGSGLGKTCGYGHQFSRSTPRGFEGGQTPLWRRLPKRGMKNPFRKDYNTVNLDTIKTCIIQKRFTPQPDRLITMRDLVTAGVTNNIKDGIHLLGRGGRNFKFKIHLEVSKASRAAIEAIEKAGGTVTCTYFSKLALRALVKPWKFDLLPWRPRPAPVPMQFYLDKNNCGYLAPEIQKRNLKLFGAATSEKMYREEHYCTLVVKREQWKVEREKQAKGFLESREKHARKLEARAERDRLKQQAENVSI